MRSQRRSLLEVHGVSHSSLQRHPHPDAEDDEIRTLGARITDFGARTDYFNLSDRELNTPSRTSVYSESSPLSRSGLTRIEEMQQDIQNIHKRAPSLQTVYSYKTESSCSWSEENDKESTEKVRMKLEECDNILYDECCPEILESGLLEDYTNWKSKFPYLRIVGKQITPTLQAEDGLFENLTAADTKDCPSAGDRQYVNNEQADDTSVCADDFGIGLQEEMIDQDGIYYENTLEEPKLVDSIQSMAQVQKIKDKVVEMLVDHLLSKMVEWNTALGKNNRKIIARVHSSVTRLPPLPTANSLTARRSPVQRPLTSLQQKRRLLPTKNIGPERYLQGLLTISSKVLQNRRQNTTSEEWFNEITPENLTKSQDIPSNPSDHSILALKRVKEHNVDHRLNRISPAQQLHVDEVENNASLPNINQRTGHGSHHVGTRTENMRLSPSRHKHRLLSVSKNLPFLKHESSTPVQRSPPSPRITSAIPNNKVKSGYTGRRSSALRSSRVGEVHFPLAVQRNSSDAAADETRIMLSPFSLLPIVKSLTPLASTARPKSRSEGRIRR